MYRLPIVLILLAGLCFGCGTRQDTAQNIDGMTRLLLTKETEATPADFIADYRYVPLGTTRQPVGNIDQLLVTRRGRKQFLFSTSTVTPALKYTGSVAGRKNTTI